MKIRLVILLVFLFGLGLATLLIAPNLSAENDRSFLTAAVERAPLSEVISASAILEPSRVVQVGAQVSGQLKTVHVRLGDTVHMGDLVAEIDSRQQEDEIRLAKASLAEFVATKHAREVELEKATRLLERQKRLLTQHATSLSAFEDAQSAVGAAEAQIELSTAQIETAKVAVEKAENDLRYTRITAPMDGTIVYLAAEPGQTLNAIQNTPIIAVIANLRQMTVKVKISEVDIGKIKVGQTAQFTTFADRTSAWAGTLEQIQPVPSTFIATINTPQDDGENSSAKAVYYYALFNIKNIDGKLKPMMSADVTITVGDSTDALQVPLAALQRTDRSGYYMATVLLKEGKVEHRQIRVGLTNDTHAQVLDGLSAGEQVVLGLQSGPTDTDKLL